MFSLYFIPLDRVKENKTFNNMSQLIELIVCNSIIIIELAVLC